MANVLVVEDDPMNLELLSLDLEDLGHAFRHAGDAESAVRMAGEEETELVLLDITIPLREGEPHNHQPHGLHACREIRKSSRTLPIIAVTAHGMAQMRQAVMEAGCNDILEKPFDFDDLASCLAKWLKDGTSDGAHE